MHPLRTELPKTELQVVLVSVTTLQTFCEFNPEYSSHNALCSVCSGQGGGCKKAALFFRKVKCRRIS